MKRAIIIAVALAVGCIASAQNDTTVVRSTNIKFDIETYKSDKGNTKTNVCCTIDGRTYPSAKCYAERYATAKRFGCIPNVAIVTSGKNRYQRVIVL